MDEPVVVTGIGLVTSLGWDRESSWRGIRLGRTRIRPVRNLPPLPDNLIWGATVPGPVRLRGVDKILAMARHAALEALRDAGLRQPRAWRPERAGCAFNAHMGYLDWYYAEALPDHGRPPDVQLPWYRKWLPHSTCVEIARCFRLHGPRLAYSTACASSLIALVSAARTIQTGQADLMLAGGSDAIDPLFAAGFYRMGVLASREDGEPHPVCRPFDEGRSGFVLGEGAAVLVLERLSHALRRGARIYAEWLGAAVLNEAHHVTSLEVDSKSLARLLQLVLQSARLSPDQIDYVNAHGTGTQQNDFVEITAYRQVLAAQNRNLMVSSIKSILGHLINASGAVETAITVLALRDGFLPATLNVRRIDPSCTFNCLPGHGVKRKANVALKVSLAFGGHLAAVVLRRWHASASSAGHRLARAA
ncbi:MAG: 3-oxoacyl-[acyl-carrier-protein] synthase 2 [Pirellulaceae bacterium]|nr:MAG: 3-oxoacyl-[acyl-carrier-protein] synthase 2 [Pirellulaceae bacterium]